MSITPLEFDYVSGLIRRTSAIVLDRGKEYLIESRLQPVAESHGLKTVNELIRRLQNESAPSSALQTEVTDALTTNETYFFRDVTPFETLRADILPPILEQNLMQRSLNVLSAACSTGQEAYSIAIILREHFPQLASWTIKIHAVDLCSTALARARAGRYSASEVQRGLPPEMLAKYFRPDEGGHWIVKDELRALVEFRQLNLLHAWPYTQPFDIVFLRNVLIYFDLPTKQAILSKARAHVQPQGILFLGGAETTINISPHWYPVRHAKATVYKPERRAQPRVETAAA